MGDPLENDHIRIEIEDILCVRVPVTAPVAGDLQPDVPLVRWTEIDVVPLFLQLLSCPNQAKSATTARIGVKRGKP